MLHLTWNIQNYGLLPLDNLSTQNKTQMSKIKKKKKKVK